MTTLNPDGQAAIAALLALLDAAAALIRLPPDVRYQFIGHRTIQDLLEDAKSLDRALDANLRKSAPTAGRETRQEQPEDLAPLRDLGVLCGETPPTAPNAPKRPRRHERPFYPQFLRPQSTGNRKDATGRWKKSRKRPQPRGSIAETGSPLIRLTHLSDRK